MTVGDLGTSPFTINGATFSYQLRDAMGTVPEPATWVILLRGFALTGVTLRRRRTALPAFA
jgi:hypothetical protein